MVKPQNQIITKFTAGPAVVAAFRAEEFEFRPAFAAELSRFEIFKLTLRV
jgi:hypothetical protein